MDTFAVYPWREWPLWHRVDWDRPAWKVWMPSVLLSEDFTKPMPTTDTVETLVLHRRLIRSPRPGCPSYDFAVYTADDAETERVMARLRIVGKAVQLLHWICSLRGL